MGEREVRFAHSAGRGSFQFCATLTPVRSIWTSDHDFTVEGTAYRSMVDRTRPDQMVVLKDRRQVEFYEALFATTAPRTILELGIYNGGSVALFSQLATPEKLVALDRRGGCPPLEAFLDERDLRGSVVAYYGVDQADAAALDRIMESEFTGPVDLIVDDASHLGDLTRASFNRLFPRVRPGGLYVIEDWSWPHRPPARDMPVEDVPISAFVAELVLLAAGRPQMIADIRIDEYAVTLTRGDADLRPERFAVSTNLDPLARRLVGRMARVSA